MHEMCMAVEFALLNRGASIQGISSEIVEEVYLLPLVYRL